MLIPITDELREICRAIESEQRSDDAWSLEDAEFWFQITLRDVHELAVGRDLTIVGRTPD